MAAAPKATTPKVPGPKTPGLMTPYKQKEDDVAKIATGIMSTKSPLMKQAETAGQQQANRRGLLNSSVAVGASQAEGYKVAVPMALQQAQQGAAANLSNQGFEQDRVLVDTQERGQNARLDKSLASDKELAQMRETGENTRLGRSLTSAEKLAALRESGENARLGRTLTSSEKVATMQERGQSARLDKNIASDRYLANLSESGANRRQTQQLSAQERMSAADRAATTARADADRRAQLTIADWNLDAADREGAMRTLTSFEQLYDERVKAINANKNLKGKDRQKQLDGLKEQQTKRRNLVRQLYDMKISW